MKNFQRSRETVLLTCHFLLQKSWKFHFFFGGGILNLKESWVRFRILQNSCSSTYSNISTELQNSGCRKICFSLVCFCSNRPIYTSVKNFFPIRLYYVDLPFLQSKETINTINYTHRLVNSLSSKAGFTLEQGSTE